MLPFHKTINEQNKLMTIQNNENSTLIHPQPPKNTSQDSNFEKELSNIKEIMISQNFDKIVNPSQQQQKQVPQKIKQKQDRRYMLRPTEEYYSIDTIKNKINKKITKKTIQHYFKDQTEIPTEQMLKVTKSLFFFTQIQQTIQKKNTNPMYLFCFFFDVFCFKLCKKKKEHHKLSCKIFEFRKRTF